MIQFRLLGTLDLRDSQDSELRAVLRRPKLLALLGYLVAACPHGFHRRDVLVALLWPELDHTHARNALSQAVHAMRKALGPEVVLARGEEELAVSAEHLSCDVREFEAALDAGEAERALELYRGGLLTGFHVSEAPEFERWLDEEREGLRRRACEAAHQLADREAAARNPVGEARWTQRLTELSPFDETVVRRLIDLLDRMGDRAGAVRAYEEFERRLGRDLEVEPSPETRRFVEGIRARRAPTPVAAAEPEAAEANSAGVAARAPSAIGPVRWRSSRARLGLRIAVVMLGGGVLTGGWLLFGAPFGARSAETTPEPKKLVVLPFSNLGPAEDGYFADGVTEEITARLATIGDLRVIGTTSARVYRGSNKSIAEIGRELGVDYVLEGSVRWQKPARGGARVRVTPQLVSTADGTHLWAEVYDEPLDQIFRVQSEIAMKVVQALDVTLGAPQRRAVEAAPTRDLQAYDYYLRANDYRRRGAEERYQRATIRMYEKAVELDPGFALAWAKLSRAHARMYLLHYDRSASRLALAKRAVDKAFELAPDLPEAHHSLGTYYWLGHLDYDRALREFAIAEAGRPNDSEIFSARAVLRQRQGKLRAALEDHERALQLDPASPNGSQQFGLTYTMLRDFRRAEAMHDRALALQPDFVEAHFSKATLALRWDGRTDRARTGLAEARNAGVADAPYLVLAQLWIELFDRKYQDALDVLASRAPEVFADQNRFVPKTLFYAQIYRLMGRAALSMEFYDSARVYLAEKVREHPEDPRLHSALGIAYAGLGRKREAIQQGQRAIELLPVTKEAFRGYHFEWDLARIYTMVGEHELAVRRLEYLLSIPGWLAPAWLRGDPDWDPLRDHPRFQRLVGRTQ